MAFAHRKARHGFNTSLIVPSGFRVRCSLGQAETEYARIVAQHVDRPALTIPACLSYAAELQKALVDCWWQASVMRSRHVPVAAPSFSSSQRKGRAMIHNFMIENADALKARAARNRNRGYHNALADSARQPVLG